MIYILSSLLVLSVSVNVIVIWYIRKLLQNYNDSLDKMVTIFSELAEFQEQIEKVYNMEVYYGDVTIENMINNITTMSNKIEKFLLESSETLGGDEE